MGEKTNYVYTTDVLSGFEYDFIELIYSIE